jgi:ferredoxin
MYILKHGKNERRWLALALCVLLAVVSAHSAAFVAANADHVCHDGGACAVCAHLTAAGSLLNSFSAPAADTLRAFVASFVDSGVPESAVSYIYTDTPIRLKVKLNN